MNEGLHISDACVNLVKAFEGMHKISDDGMVRSYRCPAGRWTIGYGHTKGVRSGMKITQDEAEDILRADLLEFENDVKKYVRVELTQAQLDALVSFVFNVGPAAFAASTLLKKVNSGDTNGAAAQFARWNKATVNGKKTALPGLTRRRTAEAALFAMDAPLGATEAPAQKVELETPKPLTQSKTMAGAAVAGTAVALTQTAEQLQPLVGYSEYVKYLFLALSLAGVALVAYARWKDSKDGVR